ncbi:hypothetical protein L3Y34_014918 [Caenorhabditis briggsae]|uniref:Uncharacterized protein n=1 Tax=Caenorhabditis briggsae TaxID=6238 RepID=A0AAE9IYG1_CAEBR|nr:hypothetical protein L3Y34_014918 [Caenorhabditis briggsae]
MISLQRRRSKSARRMPGARIKHKFELLLLVLSILLLFIHPFFHGLCKFSQRSPSIPIIFGFL